MTGNTLIRRAANLIRYANYFPSEFLVSETNRFVFMPIPKVACTSIKIALFESEQIAQDSYYTAMSIHGKTEKFTHYSLDHETRAYFKFAFVRNPFSRLVSCYKDKVKREIQHHGRYHFDTNYNKIIIRLFAGTPIKQNMSFSEFVQVVCKVPDWIAEPHFKSQYSVLCPRGKLIPDYIGKLEELPDSWQQINVSLGKVHLPVYNSTSDDNWKTHYQNRKIVQLVAKRFWKEIQLFGYDRYYRELLDSSDPR